MKYRSFCVACWHDLPSANNWKPSRHSHRYDEDPPLVGTQMWAHNSPGNRAQRSSDSSSTITNEINELFNLNSYATHTDRIRRAFGDKRRSRSAKCSWRHDRTAWIGRRRYWLRCQLAAGAKGTVPWRTQLKGLEGTAHWHGTGHQTQFAAFTTVLRDN